MRYAHRILTILTLSLLPLGAVADHPGLNLEAARRAAAAAEAEARRLGAGGAFAVVDDGGHLVYLERLDNTFPASAIVAAEKARTAATFRRPTRDFEEAVRNGRVALVAVPPMLPLQGGVPLVRDGRVVGAIGVSGAASAQQDDDLANVAAAAFAALSAATGQTVSRIDGDTVTAGFARGAPLLENGEFKVHASRREAPGQAEVHTRDTDIVYVLKGAATLVTGGTVVEGKTTAPDEIRGAAISGGDTSQLAPGDVVIVPRGTPHWFKQVQGPFLYYVVKVTGS